LLSSDNYNIDDVDIIYWNNKINDISDNDIDNDVDHGSYNNDKNNNNRHKNDDADDNNDDGSNTYNNNNADKNDEIINDTNNNQYNKEKSRIRSGECTLCVSTESKTPLKNDNINSNEQISDTGSNENMSDIEKKMIEIEDRQRLFRLQIVKKI
jgi:hypothetical protein